jgi:excisionase family DNA binding protein
MSIFTPTSKKRRKSLIYKTDDFKIQDSCSPMQIFENLISKKELAQKLSLSIAMIDKLMAQGLPHYKIGRTVRFNHGQVMEHLERRKFP